MSFIEKSSGGVLVHKVNGVTKALLIRVRKDKFELPKGHIENDETATDAALREIIEETGITGEIFVERFLKTISYEFESDGQKVKKEVQYFCIASKGQLNFGVKPKRTREIRWISREELNSIPLINSELREIIEMAFS